MLSFERRHGLVEYLLYSYIANIHRGPKCHLIISFMQSRLYSSSSSSSSTYEVGNGRRKKKEIEASEPSTQDQRDVCEYTNVMYMRYNRDFVHAYA